MSDGNGLPNGWTVEMLGTVAVSTRPRGNPRDSAGLDFVGLEHVEPHTTRLIGSVPAESMKSSGVQFRRGDVLYARMRPYLNKVWCSDRDGLCSGEFFVFPGDEAMEGRFLAYRMSMQDFVAYANHAATGDRPRADLEHISRFEIAIPPQAEQARIADRIDELFTDLAAGVAALERVQKKLKRYRSAVLHAAVTGRLTEAWRQEHGPPAESGEELLARLLIERRRQWEERTLADYEAKGKKPPKNWQQRYKEPVEPKTDDLPELPEGWCWASVEQLSTKVVDGVHKKPHYVESGVPFVTVRNLTAGPGISFESLNYVTVEDHQSFIKRTDPERGDVLISKDGTLGVTRLVDTDQVFSIFVSVALVKPVDRSMGAFVTLALSSPVMQAQMVPKGSGLQHIHLEDLRLDCAPLPPLGEQAEIIEIAQEKLSQIEAMETEVERGLARAKRLRQAVLKAAFAGELVEQDPNDEPASVLLNRIRAERETMTAKPNGWPKGSHHTKAVPKKSVTTTKKTTTKKKARKS